MRRIAVAAGALAGCLGACACTALAAAPSRRAPLPVALPDTGTFSVSLGGRPSGEERFAIRRDGRDVLAEGHAAIQLGGFALDATSRLRLDAALHPLHFSAEAVTDGRAADVDVTFRAGRSIVRTVRDSTARADTIDYATDAVFVPDNTLYALVLLYHAAARRGLASGQASMPLYPKGTVDVRRAGSRVERGLRVTAYEVNLSHLLALTVLVDARGRVVRISVPLQSAEMERRGAFPDAAARDSAGGAGEAPAAPPRPVPADLRARDVVFPSGDVPLAGTLLRPAGARGPLPAVVLLSGSGAQDRDENSPGAGGVKLGIFRAVAERLARAGIAVLRFDDRGVGASGGTFAGTTFSDHVADARAALSFLRTQPDVDTARTGLVGHSEGAIIALHVAADDPRVRAIALMAGTAQPFSEILMAQAIDQARKAGLPEAAVRGVASEESVFIAAVKARREWTADTVPERMMELRSMRPWLEEVLALDTPPVVERVRCPAGIFQGGMDDQVSPRAAGQLDSLLTAGGNVDHAVYRFPRLNHLFARSEGGGYAEYTDTRRHVDERFLDALARWTRAHLAR